MIDRFFNKKYLQIKILALLSVFVFLFFLVLPRSSYIAIKMDDLTNCSTIETESKTHQIHQDLQGPEHLYGKYIIQFNKGERSFKLTCKTYSKAFSSFIDFSNFINYKVVSFTDKDGIRTYQVKKLPLILKLKNIYTSYISTLYFTIAITIPFLLIVFSKTRSLMLILYLSTIAARLITTLWISPGLYDIDGINEHLGGYLGASDLWFGNHYRHLWIGITQLFNSKISMSILQSLFSGSMILLIFEMLKPFIKNKKTFISCLLVLIVFNPLTIGQDLYLTRDVLFTWTFLAFSFYLITKHNNILIEVALMITASLALNLRREALFCILITFIIVFLRQRKAALITFRKKLLPIMFISASIFIPKYNSDTQISKNKIAVSLFHYSSEIVWGLKSYSYSQSDYDFLNRYIDLKKAALTRKHYSPDVTYGTFRESFHAISYKDHNKLIKIFLNVFAHRPLDLFKIRISQYLGAFNIFRPTPHNMLSDDFAYSPKESNSARMDLFPSMGTIVLFPKFRKRFIEVYNYFPTTLPYLVGLSFILTLMYICKERWLIPSFLLILFHELVLFGLSPSSMLKYHYSLLLYLLVISSLWIDKAIDKRV